MDHIGNGNKTKLGSLADQGIWLDSSEQSLENGVGPRPNFSVFLMRTSASTGAPSTQFTIGSGYPWVRRLGKKLLL